MLQNSQGVPSFPPLSLSCSVPPHGGSAPCHFHLRACNFILFYYYVITFQADAILPCSLVCHLLYILYLVPRGVLVHCGASSFFFPAPSFVVWVCQSLVTHVQVISSLWLQWVTLPCVILHTDKQTDWQWYSVTDAEMETCRKSLGGEEKAPGWGW